MNKSSQVVKRRSSVFVWFRVFSRFGNNDPRNHTKPHEHNHFRFVYSWIVLPGEKQSLNIGYH
jgi:hypothetical protein